MQLLLSFLVELRWDEVVAAPSRSFEEAEDHESHQIDLDDD